MNESGANQARETSQVLDCYYRFILWLIPTLVRFPRSQKFLLGDRIQGAAIDVLEALIEATYTNHRDGPLSRANLGIKKLRFFFRLCRDLKYLDPRRHEFSVHSLNETVRRVGAWRKIHRNYERK